MVREGAAGLGAIGFAVGLFAPPLLAATAIGAVIGAGTGKLLHHKTTKQAGGTGRGHHPRRRRRPDRRLPALGGRQSRTRRDPRHQEGRRRGRRPPRKGPEGRTSPMRSRRWPKTAPDTERRAVMSPAGRVREQTAGRVREQIAYIRGMHVCLPFPLVMMDVTRQVMTAAPDRANIVRPAIGFTASGNVVTPRLQERGAHQPELPVVGRVPRSRRGAGRLLPSGDHEALAGGAGHGHVDRQLRLDRQPHHRRESRSLPDRRTPLERHAATRHRGDVPPPHAIRTGAGTDRRHRSAGLPRGARTPGRADDHPAQRHRQEDRRW